MCDASVPGSYFIADVMVRDGCEQFLKLLLVGQYDIDTDGVDILLSINGRPDFLFLQIFRLFF